MPDVTKRRTTMFTTPSDREIVATHIVEAPRALVFQAHIRPEHVREWLLGPDGWTMPVCEIDLRPGGKWHYLWRDDNGTEMWRSGVFQEVIAPTRLVHSESSGGESPETLHTLILTEDAGRTTITSRVRYPSKQDRDAARSTRMEDGWARSYERLDEYLRGAVARLAGPTTLSRK